YRASYELVLELVRTVASVFTEVAFPTFARLRRNRAQLAEQFIAFTRQSFVAILPFLLVVFIAAEEALATAWGPSTPSPAPRSGSWSSAGPRAGPSRFGPPLLAGIGSPNLTLLYHGVAALVLPFLFVIFGSTLRGLGFISVALGWVVGYPIAFAVLAFLAV